ncbi:hypothetical protein [Bacillus sp. AK031]
MNVLGIILMPLFLVSLWVSLKFIFGDEGKDERGSQIKNAAYTYSFPIFPIGWLLIDSYHSYISPMTFAAYQDAIWILVLLTFIVQGLVIFIYKRKM